MLEQNRSKNNFGINYSTAKANGYQVATEHAHQFIGSEYNAQFEFIHKKKPY